MTNNPRLRPPLHFVFFILGALQGLGLALLLPIWQGRDLILDSILFNTLIALIPAVAIAPMWIALYGVWVIYPAVLTRLIIILGIAAGLTMYATSVATLSVPFDAGFALQDWLYFTLAISAFAGTAWLRWAANKDPVDLAEGTKQLFRSLLRSIAAMGIAAAVVVLCSTLLGVLHTVFNASGDINLLNWLHQYKLDAALAGGLFLVTLYSCRCRTDQLDALIEMLLKGVPWVLISYLIGIATVLLMRLAGMDSQLWSQGYGTLALTYATLIGVLLYILLWREGTAAHVPAALDWPLRLGTIIPIILALGALQGLWLRVQQYGWNVDRIGLVVLQLSLLATAGAQFTASFAGPSRWPVWRIGHLLTLVATCVLMLALHTPPLHIAKLASDDLLERHTLSGRAPETLDYDYLRLSLGHFGMDTLQSVASIDDRSGKIAMQVLQGRLRAQQGGHSAGLPLAARVSSRGVALGLSSAQIDKLWQQLRDYPSTCGDHAGDCVVLWPDLDHDGRSEALLGGGSLDSLWRWNKDRWIRQHDSIYFRTDPCGTAPGLNASKLEAQAVTLEDKRFIILNQPLEGVPCTQ